MINTINETFERKYTANDYENFVCEIYDKEYIFDELMRYMSEDSKLNFFETFITYHGLNENLDKEFAINYIAENIKPSLTRLYKNNAREYAEFIIEYYPEISDNGCYKKYEFWHYSDDDYSADCLADNIYPSIFDMCAMQMFGYDNATNAESDGYKFVYDITLNGVVAFEPIY